MKKLPEFSNFPSLITDYPAWRNSLWRFRAVVKEVTDADTLVLLFDIGFRTYTFYPIRVDGYDAYEIFRGDERERVLGRMAKDFLSKELPLDTPVGVTTEEKESFNRYVVVVYYVKDGAVASVRGVMEKSGFTKN